MNCPCDAFDVQKYKDVPYQQTPCYNCFMTKETNNTNKHSILYDTDGALDQQLTEQAQQQLGLTEDPYDLDLPEEDQLTPEAITMVMQACQKNFLITLSNIVLKLTDIARQYPVTYQILHMKMQYPSMSYHQIGRNLNPPCSKQNVLYHLSNAVKQFPDLCSSIITDSRFSGGRFAIKRVANTANKEKQIQKIRKVLYVETEANKQKSLSELKKEFAKPIDSIPIDYYDFYKKEDEK